MPAPDSRPVLGSRTPEGKFQFFQPRLVDHFFEGRTPNANLKADAYGNRFPRESFLCVVFFVASLARSRSSGGIYRISGNTLMASLPLCTPSSAW